MMSRVSCIKIAVLLTGLFLACAARAEIPVKTMEISSVLEKYASGGLAEAEEAASKELAKCSKEDIAGGPAVVILEYLSGNKGVSQQMLFIAVEDDREYTALAALAAFLRRLALRESPDPFDYPNLLSVYLEAERRCLASDVKKWRPKVLEWKNWCAENFKGGIGLDPLLAKRSAQDEREAKSASSESEGKDAASKGPVAKARSQDYDIEKISLDEFMKLKKVYEKRPRPAGFDFDSKIMQSYVDQLPSREFKRAEVDRCAKIAKMKQYLVFLFSKNPYEGVIKNKANPKGVQGVVSMANLSNIGVRPKGKDKTEVFKWNDFDIQQMLDFLEHYAKVREKSYGGEISKEEGVKMAAEDYLSMALVADWYGKEKAALEYAKKAVQLNPALKESMGRLLLD